MMTDFFSDVQGKQLAKKLRENQEYIPLLKEAAEEISKLDVSDRDFLSNEAYADPESKTFPIHTPEHAILSSLYMQGEPVDEMTKIACEENLAFFGLDIKIKECEDVVEKTASELDALDFVLPHKAKLPIVDLNTYVKSASVFMDSLPSLTFKDKVIGSTQLVKKASELNIESDPLFEKMALKNTIDRNLINMYLDDQFVKTASESYLDIKKTISSLPDRSLENSSIVIKLANAIDEANSGETTDEFFEIFSKTASEKMDEVDGYSINFDNLDMEKLASVIGQEELEHLKSSDGDLGTEVRTYFSSLEEDEQKVIAQNLE